MNTKTLLAAALVCGQRRAGVGPAKGPFFMAMRLYWPKEEALSGK